MIYRLAGVGCITQERESFMRRRVLRARSVCANYMEGSSIPSSKQKLHSILLSK
jgi:hypothetical protein